MIDKRTSDAALSITVHAENIDVDSTSENPSGPLMTMSDDKNIMQ